MMKCVHFSEIHTWRKISRSLHFPHRYGTKEMHWKALPELQTRLKLGILTSERSLRARIQVCGERGKT